ncbi:hypothetical protein BDE18_3055 [Paracoccus pantotrophus]|uniref:Uncharacterized protein n=1 Tax=Paracoccus pantotrophus TaxID=82367 RepID=A0AAE6NUN2_PARPN|nr:hypothetical protein [Paracoccus pantotrophus]QFG35552.1 hypothetical protein ESD82_05105 [Paracoccus pantotrophus]RKS44216.1 hypothetical protein BDE18_3055 [Paracoccus pantotrophus]
MIELVFIACMGGAPADCREHSLIYTEVTPLVCMRGAQPALAQWVETHPDWRIARWSCQTLRRERSI